MKISISFPNGDRFSVEGTKYACERAWAIFMLFACGPRRLSNGRFASWLP